MNELTIEQIRQAACAIIIGAADNFVGDDIKIAAARLQNGVDSGDDKTIRAAVENLRYQVEEQWLIDHDDRNAGMVLRCASGAILETLDLPSMWGSSAPGYVGAALLVAWENGHRSSMTGIGKWLGLEDHDLDVVVALCMEGYHLPKAIIGAQMVHD